MKYINLGYVPHGIPRAEKSTVEYAYCNYTIALLAKVLGKKKLANYYFKQSQNWKNLWRSDYDHAGSKGFILPKDSKGNWLDSIPYGNSEFIQPKYLYTPVSFEGPWYTPWWSTFFYEATSWEYSLSIPHDVPGLIELSGGSEEFEKRLNTFFDRNFFNVNNEPSFLSPCLYHWIGKPHLSSERIHQIIKDSYNDGAIGLPGNDDSGAMSSWLAFHMMGIYPNAGQDYYLINTPLIETTTISLPDGLEFKISTKGFSAKNKYIQSATLNGIEYPYSVIRHNDISKGGELILKLGNKPSNWGEKMFPNE